MMLIDFADLIKLREKRGVDQLIDAIFANDFQFVKTYLDANPDIEEYRLIVALVCCATLGESDATITPDIAEDFRKAAKELVSKVSKISPSLLKEIRFKIDDLEYSILDIATNLGRSICLVSLLISNGAKFTTNFRYLRPERFRFFTQNYHNSVENIDNFMGLVFADDIKLFEEGENNLINESRLKTRFCWILVIELLCEYDASPEVRDLFRKYIEQVGYSTLREVFDNYSQYISDILSHDNFLVRGKRGATDNKALKILFSIIGDNAELYKTQIIQILCNSIGDNSEQVAEVERRSMSVEADLAIMNVDLENEKRRSKELEALVKEQDGTINFLFQEFVDLRKQFVELQLKQAKQKVPTMAINNNIPDDWTRKFEDNYIYGDVEI